MLLSIGRVAFGALALIAIAVQVGASAQQPDFTPANVLAYFTNLSNIFASLTLFYAASGAGRGSRMRDNLRGAATFCMALVGIVFAVLLAALESDVILWVNVVVHYVMPVVLVADWFIDPPQHKLMPRDMLGWLLVPIVYVSATFARGALVHWYPYPFLDIDAAGWSTVAGYLCALVAFAALLALGLGYAGNIERRRRAA